MTIKHIYYFSWRDKRSVSTRYRGLYLLEELALRKITYDFVCPRYNIGQLIKFLTLLLKVIFFRKQDSIVVYQKLYTNGLYGKSLKLLLKLSPKNTFYDTDDADYLRYPSDVIEYFIQNCNQCIVGSHALKKYASNFNEKTHIITTPVILHKHIKKVKSKTFHIGWIGDYGANDGIIDSFSHKISLEVLLYPALLALDFTFKLSLLGIKNPRDKESIETLFKNKTNITLNIPQKIDWFDENFIYEQIKDFDVGVSPMINHEFNIAKSAFKAKQYLSCGVPVLGSPIGENLTFIRNEENGYFCSSPDDFKTRIMEFSTMSHDLYLELSKNATKQINDFSMKNYVDHFLKVVTFN